MLDGLEQAIIRTLVVALLIAVGVGGLLVWLL